MLLCSSIFRQLSVARFPAVLNDKSCFGSRYVFVHRISSVPYSRRFFSVTLSKKSTHKDKSSEQLAREPRQRVTSKARRSKPGETSAVAVSHNLVVHAIGTGAAASPASVCIRSDGAYYFINCGEGVQRLLSEHKIRPSKLENIFCTSKSWRNIGGLLGMCLTLQNYGVSNIVFHGAPESLQMVRQHGVFSDDRFIEAHLKYHDSKTLGSFEDVNFVVKSIELNPRVGNPSNADEKRGVSRIDALLASTAASNSPSPAISAEADADAATGTYLFVFQSKVIPPQIDFVRCVERGLTASATIAELKDHYDDPSFKVTLPDGRVVRPADICHPAVRSGPILVFECPSLSFLRTVLHSAAGRTASNPEVAQYPFFQHCDGQEPSLVVHIAHFPVGSCEEYQHFIASFPSSTRHLVLDGSCKAPVCTELYRRQTVMNLAHPKLFPILPESNLPVNSNSHTPVAEPRHQDVKTDIIEQKSSPATEEQADSQEFKNARIRYAQPGLSYKVRPSAGFSSELMQLVNSDEHIREVFAASPDLSSVIKSLESRRNSMGVKSALYPRFVFLGTGSSVPSKARNVSGFFVELDASSCVLFDCGEGTYAQLVRHFGDESDNVLRRLRAIFISHMHADHHGGVFTMLTEWRRARLSGHNSSKQLRVTVEQQRTAFPSPYSYNYNKGQYNVSSVSGPRLLFVAPKRYGSWLNLYVDVVLNRDSSLLADIELVQSQDLGAMEERRSGAPLIRQFTQTGQNSQRNALPNSSRNAHVNHLINSCGLRSIVAVPVAHAAQSFGYVLETQGGVKMVYSGDTMPCEGLVQAGRDCDVLVHEATLEDDLHVEARAKRHSTVGQAIDVARRMRARHCILTHFSQRYLYTPPFFIASDTKSGSEGSSSVGSMKLGVAFDHLELSLDDIEFTRHLRAFLKETCRSEFERSESKAEKRKYKRLRDQDGYS